MPHQFPRFNSQATHQESCSTLPALVCEHALPLTPPNPEIPRALVVSRERIRICDLAAPPIPVSFAIRIPHKTLGDSPVLPRCLEHQYQSRPLPPPKRRRDSLREPRSFGLQPNELVAQRRITALDPAFFKASVVDERDMRRILQSPPKPLDSADKGRMIFGNPKRVRVHVDYRRIAAIRYRQPRWEPIVLRKSIRVRLQTVCEVIDDDVAHSLQPCV